MPIKKPLRLRLLHLVYYYLNKLKINVIGSDYGAFEAGLYAITWRFWWRIGYVKYDYFGELHTQWYILTGNVESQLLELWEGSVK